jgi:hypothetical protein
MRRTPRVVLVALCCAALGAAARSEAATPQCTPTLPTRSARPTATPSAAGFNYGNGGLRAQLGWPRGTLAAGILPDGGSRATVAEDGSIHAKLGWWRGGPGTLRITGRRLDADAAPLRAHVPTGYGAKGFQPTGLVFPTVGCWRVVGQVGDARLTFVVKVTRLPWH